MFAGTRKFTRYRRILVISVLVFGGLHCIRHARCTVHTAVDDFSLTGGSHFKPQHADL
jgi:hypothetical protein